MAAKEDYALQLDRQLCFPLYAATNLIQRLYRPLLAPLGLTYSQYLVLLVLWEGEPVSVGDIRACLHLDIGTISPLLKRMERDGLITRTRDTADERRVIVALTDHGHALRQQAAQLPERLAARLALPAEEVSALRAGSRALIDRLVSIA